MFKPEIEQKCSRQSRPSELLKKFSDIIPDQWKQLSLRASTVTGLVRKARKRSSQQKPGKE